MAAHISNQLDHISALRRRKNLRQLDVVVDVIACHGEGEDNKLQLEFRGQVRTATTHMYRRSSSAAQDYVE